ncbi:aminotransferase class I/II-fold pyridoxal phosphate-dependent enzyme [Vibrio hangzhouensis]|uniref:aminotransferase class I/II-fold pyridoxal phosphate-dependent enzyme n=1 Tax=Vibrio hangzhouensis TaxID=462991 RepID=UPI001C9408D2|nr:aminotransferase class I/II-fold pyridoxal phosphate-dependent enzyme [Vibrio hangzhouensis]MBY6195941.1 aminotransferase class I/II-fold pyridoxal phosphate-dependent enzyme [Vibrio hangzhouensis]
MRLFDNVTPEHLDDVRRIARLIQQDTRADTIDLVSGLLCDDKGEAMVLPCVLESQQRVGQDWGRTRFSSTRFITAVERLVFGPDYCQSYAKQLASVQAPGGTGALRLAFDFFAQQLKGKRVWIGTPCWSNYQSIASAAGIATHFFEHTTHTEAFDVQVAHARPNDAVILQAGAHNPSGTVYSTEDWYQIARVCNCKGLIPIIDNASQGLGQGIVEDSLAIRILATVCPNLIVTTSFSKNFTLYHEQVGALTVKVESEHYTDVVQQALSSIIRSNYSSPSQFGASIVSDVLNCEFSRADWAANLATVRTCLAERKRVLCQSIGNRLVAATSETHGLFFQLPLPLTAIQQLRRQHAIYMLDNGRVSLAALTPKIADAVGRSVHLYLEG